MRKGKAFSPFSWQDPLNLHSLLSEEEKLIEKSTRDYCQEKLQPRILNAFRHEGVPT